MEGSNDINTTTNKNPLANEQLRIAIRTVGGYSLQIRMIAAGLAFLSILMPWVPLGPGGAMHGGQLLTHVLAGGETWAWLTSGNLFGALMFIMFPLYMLPVLLLSLIASIRGRHSPVHNIIILVAPPITLAAAAYPMLDASPDRLFGLAMPLWGLKAGMLAHLGLLTHTMYRDFRDRWQRARRAHQGEDR